MSVAHTPFIVLFDIDGTLVSGPPGKSGAGVYAMNRASIHVTGTPSRFVGADYAGRTDIQIARMLIEDAGTPEPTPAAVADLIDAYVRHLSLHVEECPFHPIGDPRAAVRALRNAGALVGLGTGNVQRGAALKLQSAGIADVFAPLIGGFGDDGDTRAALLERGVERMDPDRRLPVVVVGDTPYDVEGAKGIGALCIGIPFGKNTAETLSAAGADALVDTIDTSLATAALLLLERNGV